MPDTQVRSVKSTEGVNRPKRSSGKVRRWGLSLLAVLLVGVIIFLLVPSPIEPVKWLAPTAPSFQEAGPWKQNNKLSSAQLITDAPKSPEFITFDKEGQLYTGDSDGKIYKVPFDAEGNPQKAQVFADTKGTPNGLKFDANGDLIVTDIMKGLLSIKPSGSIEVLANQVDGKPIYLANELDIARDGSIYFSDTSNYGRVTFKEMAENKPHGRLLKYDPMTKQTTVLFEGLYFANGVALSADEDFVLVAESYHYQLTRYWLKGPKKGTSDIFVDNLAGFPDNITRDEQGHFWVGIFTSRISFVDQMHRNPWLAGTMAKIPESLLSGASAPAKHGLAVELSPQGELIESWHDPEGSLYGVTTAVNHNGYLYIGTAPGGSEGVRRLRVTK
ncbi:SMP-30/gluconolactonase/LRE family protein [Paenibacillus sp. SYP-B3998]|uniref:SMP-30/gluconolactonase/LRE family protein n=1 Tax=Paenibacillus sp. SYP-B3998 TaxID=2678564 RepID=A0A6G4A563_9BACL|nr:SMP-30/gluconolactonase/LRE family protein [Paenibacillus sp. SYP-B3998]NEW09084.1 SMP-30/gluconolactonase/LRE family protein [Paenibacillus sp. SYP-B3998]